MNERNRFTGSTAFKVMSVVLPLLSLAGVAAGIYLFDEITYVKLIMCVGYVLCFDFAYLFFLGSSDRSIIRNSVFAIIGTIAPAICFFAVYLPYSDIISIILFGMIILICGTVDFSVSLLMTVAIAGYCGLFTANTLEIQALFLIFTFISCIFIRNIRNKSALVYSIILSIIFYCICLVVGSGFVLEKAFEPINIIKGIIFIILTTAVYIIKIYCIPNEDTSDSDIASQENTSRPNILKQDSNTRKQYENVIRDLKNENKQMKRKLESVIEEKEKLQAESIKITEENFDAVEQFKNLYHENQSLKETIEELKKLPASIEESISSDFEFIDSFKRESPKLFKHCQTIARISSDAAQLIGCDSELAYALGMYHESFRLLGDDYVNILTGHFRVPHYIVHVVELLKDKNNNLPIPREAGIVILTDDIVGTSNYLRNKNESVPIDRIVTNTIKVRKDQNILRLAGFSNEEVQLLKLFFIESGGTYDTSD